MVIRIMTFLKFEISVPPSVLARFARQCNFLCVSIVLRLYCKIYSLDNPFHIVQHLIVPKADHPIAL